MFSVAIDFLIDLVNLIPYFVVIILAFNICANLLWGGKNE